MKNGEISKSKRKAFRWGKRWVHQGSSVTSDRSQHHLIPCTEGRFIGLWKRCPRGPPSPLGLGCLI